MPFQTTDVIPNNPKVNVAFSGLMVLRPGANNTCEVGIHRFNVDHVFQVMLIVQKPGRPPLLIPLLRGPLTADFLIRLQPDPDLAAGDFSVFAPTPEPFDRGADTNDALDYRWAVNLREFHPNADINDGAKPLVTLKTGVLYTSHLTIDSLSPQLVRQDSTTIDLHRFAANLAAAITPPPDTQVLLSWNDLGDPQELLLPRDADHSEPDTTYTVFFINDRSGVNVEPGDEMVPYYKVLKDKDSGRPINRDERLSLNIIRGGTRTDEIPCLTVTLNP